MLMALLSHLDLYCSRLEISQGLPDTAQGCRNSLWCWQIKSNGEVHSYLLCFICGRRGADENTAVSTVIRKLTEVSCRCIFTAALTRKQAAYAHKWTFASHFSPLKGALHTSSCIQRTLSGLFHFLFFPPLFVFERNLYISTERLLEAVLLLPGGSSDASLCTELNQ